jgi:hypothetical protein
MRCRGAIRVAGGGGGGGLLQTAVRTALIAAADNPAGGGGGGRRKWRGSDRWRTHWFGIDWALEEPVCRGS